MTRKRKIVRSVTPRALIRDWLDGIGADHVTVHDGCADRPLDVGYALQRLRLLRPDDVRINTLGLKAVVLRGGEVVAAFHTPTFEGEPIYWEQIA